MKFKNVIFTGKFHMFYFFHRLFTCFSNVFHPVVIGGIISWILNRAKDIVGWVSQNLWALVVGIGGLIYTFMVTRK